MQPSIPPGKLFGRYQIVRLLGSGAMGSVHEARHVELDRRVALKTIRRSLAVDDMAQRRFVREGKAVAKIEHPHVVSISDVGTEDGVPYLVMEYLEGETLGALLTRESPLTVARGGLLLPIVSAVHAAHEHGIVHRSPAGERSLRAHAARRAHLRCSISGISKVEGSIRRRPAPACSWGRRAMLAGQAKSSRHAGPRSDQYVFGVMLYECVTGKRPFEGESSTSPFNIVEGECVKPSGWVPDSHRGSRRSSSSHGTRPGQALRVISLHLGRLSPSPAARRDHVGTGVRCARGSAHARDRHPEREPVGARAGTPGGTRRRAHADRATEQALPSREGAASPGQRCAARGAAERGWLPISAEARSAAVTIARTPRGSRRSWARRSWREACSRSSTSSGPPLPRPPSLPPNRPTRR